MTWIVISQNYFTSLNLIWIKLEQVSQDFKNNLSSYPENSTCSVQHMALIKPRGIGGCVLEGQTDLATALNGLVSRKPPPDSCSTEGETRSDLPPPPPHPPPLSVFCSYPDPEPTAMSGGEREQSQTNAWRALTSQSLWLIRLHARPAKSGRSPGAGSQHRVRVMLSSGLGEERAGELECCERFTGQQRSACRAGAVNQECARLYRWK